MTLRHLLSPYRSAGRYAIDELLIPNDGDAVDDHVLDADRRRVGSR